MEVAEYDEGVIVGEEWGGEEACRVSSYMLLPEDWYHQFLAWPWPTSRGYCQRTSREEKSLIKNVELGGTFAPYVGAWPMVGHRDKLHTQMEASEEEF